MNSTLLSIVTPPADTMVTLDEVKRHLAIGGLNDWNDLLTQLIEAASVATEGLHGATKRCFVNQTVARSFSTWPRNHKAPFPNCNAVRVTYRDSAGDEQVLDPTMCKVEGDEFVWFTPDFNAPSLSDNFLFPVTIEYTCGLGADNTTVPQDVKTAVMSLVAHWYENREAVQPNERRVEFNKTPLLYQAMVARYSVGL